MCGGQLSRVMYIAYIPSPVPPRWPLISVPLTLRVKKLRNKINISHKGIRGLVGTGPEAYLERSPTNTQARGADLRVRVAEMRLGMNMEYQARVGDTKPRLPAEYGYQGSGEERKNSSPPAVRNESPALGGLGSLRGL